MLRQSSAQAPSTGSLEAPLVLSSVEGAGRAGWAHRVLVRNCVLKPFMVTPSAGLPPTPLLRAFGISKGYGGQAGLKVLRPAHAELVEASNHTNGH